MLCAVYRSTKKPQTYLFLARRDDFASVPDALMEMFGKPSLVTVLNLAQRPTLAMADINKVKQALFEPGYYLQLPPPIDNLLEQHKRHHQSSKT